MYNTKSMKMILLKDDKKLGKKGDLITASDGFAFNNLIPRKIAKPATEQVIAAVKRDEAKQKKEFDAMKERLREDAKKIDKKKVIIHAQAKGDKLFGSVTQKDIAAAIIEQLGVNIEEKNVLLTAPIKELTTREVRVDYGFGISAGIVVAIASK